MSVCGEVSANSIWFTSSLKDNHKLNPPSRKRLMKGINNDATLYIEAYGFTACFPRVYVPCACERREGGKRPFLIKKSIPLFCKPTLLPSTQALAVSVKSWMGGKSPRSSQTKTSCSALNGIVCILISVKSPQYILIHRQYRARLKANYSGCECRRIPRLSVIVS